MDIEEDHCNNSVASTSSLPSNGIAFTLKRGNQPKNKIVKKSIFQEEDDNADELVTQDVIKPSSSASTTFKTCKQDNIAKIFRPEFAPDVINLKASIDLNLEHCPIDFQSKFTKKVSIIFFSGKIEKKLSGLMKLRGFNYELNLESMEDATLQKLVLLRMEFKQDRDIDDCEISNEPMKKPILSVQNAISAGAYDDFLNLARRRLDNNFLINEYDDMFNNHQLQSRMQRIRCLNNILGQVQSDVWSMNTDCALYYYAQESMDYESDMCSWDIGVLTPVENFFQFHMQINNKSIF